LFPIVNRAPGSRGRERSGLFPATRARGVILFFVASPKNVTHAQSPGEIAPIGCALHQFAEEVLGFSVIVESLRPKMTGISHHNFAAIEQKRMIVSWPRGKTRFERHFPNCIGHRIHFAALRKTKTAFAASESAK